MILGQNGQNVSPKQGQKDFSEHNEHRHILILPIFRRHAKNPKILMTKSRKNRKTPYFSAQKPILGPKIRHYDQNRRIIFFEKSGFVKF